MDVVLMLAVGDLLIWIFNTEVLLSVTAFAGFFEESTIRGTASFTFP